MEEGFTTVKPRGYNSTWHFRGKKWEKRITEKFWHRRYILFSKFDEGIKIDSEESWYSITPEWIAKRIAERCKCDVIVDGFCGVGGNTIQFALTCKKVIAIDIDPKKIEAAKHNAKVYGVADRIEFIVGDFFDIVPGLKNVDIVFLSPPWGGPNYTKADVFDLKEMIPMDGIKVFDTALSVTNNVAFYLPKNTSLDQLVDLAGPDPEDYVTVEKHKVNGWVLALTAFFGDLAVKDAVVKENKIRL